MFSKDIPFPHYLCQTKPFIYKTRNDIIMCLRRLVESSNVEFAKGRIITKSIFIDATFFYVAIQMLLGTNVELQGSKPASQFYNLF